MTMSLTTRLIVLVAMTLLQGCATRVLQPPLEAGWYFQTWPEAASSGEACAAGPQIEIILLNRSSRIIDVAKVVLNEHEPQSPASGTGAWIWEGRFSLLPGGFKPLPTNCFKRDSTWTAERSKRKFSELCVLPVSISVEVEPETRAGLRRIYGVDHMETRVPVEMVGRMPSSLAKHWRECNPVIESESNRPKP